MKNNHFDSKRDCNMPITQRDHNACFTLIELLIVIAIISILAPTLSCACWTKPDATSTRKTFPLETVCSKSMYPKREWQS